MAFFITLCKAIGYKQILMDESDYKSMNLFKDIVDIDNVNHRSNSKCNQVFEKTDSKFLANYKKPHKIVE